MLPSLELATPDAGFRMHVSEGFRVLGFAAQAPFFVARVDGVLSFL